MAVPIVALLLLFLSLHAIDVLLLVPDAAACCFSFNAPLQVFHGELGGEPQDKFHVISNVAFTVTVHELDLEFVAELVILPNSFESNGETRILSAWQGGRFFLKTISAEDSPNASIDIGNEKGFPNQEIMAFWYDCFHIFKPGSYVARIWDE